MREWTPMDWHNVVRMTFYFVGTVVTVAPFWKAKNGLLNTVNTEYQKRVMDRLKEISDKLYSEFDPDSPEYWAKGSVAQRELRRINKIFLRDKDKILAAGFWPYGVPVTKDTITLRKILGPLESDPFVPKKIRDDVITFLSERLAVMESIYFDTFEKYQNKLSKGKQEPVSDLDGLNKIHNEIVRRLNEQGCGISEIEKEVHGIRLEIQKYFESFTPKEFRWPGK